MFNGEEAAIQEIDQQEQRWRHVGVILLSEVVTFLQRFVPHAATAFTILVFPMMHADRQLNHSLPKQAAAAVQFVPDFFPRIVSRKIIPSAKERYTLT